MVKGDISQLTLGDIYELCIHISRGKARTRKNPRDPIMSRINKYVDEIVSRDKIGNLLDNFKTYILECLGEKIDTLKVKNKKKDKTVSLSILFPKCRNKHALRECPLHLKSVETRVICAENHDTKECTSIPSLKIVYQ